VVGKKVQERTAVLAGIEDTCPSRSEASAIQSADDTLILYTELERLKQELLEVRKEHSEKEAQMQREAKGLHEEVSNLIAQSQKAKALATTSASVLEIADEQAYEAIVSQWEEQVRVLRKELASAQTIEQASEQQLAQLQQDLKTANEGKSSTKGRIKLWLQVWQ
jgi:chromosome segregation ATPase